jgi:hypothetical protein
VCAALAAHATRVLRVALLSRLRRAFTEGVCRLPTRLGVRGDTSLSSRFA